jgi:hypothetical protein
MMIRHHALAPDILARAVLRVGDARGFVVERRGHFNSVKRIVITAAHCLPRLPPPYEHLLDLPTPHPARYPEEETYQRLLGPLGIEPAVWATCLFVDPIADIAVLGRDNQSLGGQADAYDELIDNMTALTLADAPAQGFELVTASLMSRSRKIKKPTPGEGTARVLSLEGQWLEGRVLRRGGWLEFQPHEAFVGGMSGSPILNIAGAAIGVISGPHASPVIVDSLSARLVRAITRAKK